MKVAGRGSLRTGATARDPARKDDALSSTDLQREIAAEQTYVDRLYRHLDTLRERARRALDQVRRAPFVPTPGGRTERDAFDALHTERLRQLSAVEERLAFGRLDLGGGQTRYVGRIGLSDENQSQLLVDWRAPAASAFYQATAAAPDGVVRRRHIALRGRSVTGLDDEVLDGDALAADGRVLSTVTGEGALMSALTAHRTDRMRDIVATLQAEQDRIVRAPLDGVLVVQGGPGTGKTAVALHRAAYLLYTHRDRISGSGVLIVGPSAVFLRYIEQVLPSLGETGVVMLTPGQLMPGLDTTAVDRDEVAVLKGDLRMASVIRSAVRARQRTLPGPVRLVVGGDELVLQPRVVADARGRARQTGRPHNEARLTFVRQVLADLAGQLAEARGVETDDGEREDLLAELRDTRAVRREVNLLWMPLTAPGLVGDLLTRPDRLAVAADGTLTPAEQELLHRGRDLPWTVSDVPLLDEAAELIGPDVAEAAAARAAERTAAAERAEAVAFARSVLRESGAAASMMTPEMLADRFAESAPVGSLAERARTDRSWAFGHAVIDEAQELSSMQWRAIVRRVPSRSLTVVGDVAQTGSAAGTGSWAAALEPHATGRWRVEELTVNYRTPSVVMDLATGLLSAHGIEVTSPRAAREGQWPPLAVPLPGADPEILVGAALAVLAADDEALGGGRFAVIVPRASYPQVRGQFATGLADHAAGGDLTDRVDILTVDSVKGLEFDAVVVLEPAAVMAESRRGVSDLYVALTRPTQRLTLVHSADLPPGLDAVAGLSTLPASLA